MIFCKEAVEMECLDECHKELKILVDNDKVYRLQQRHLAVVSSEEESQFIINYSVIPIQFLSFDFDFESYGINHAKYLKSEVLMNENYLQIIDILDLLVGKKKRAQTLIWHYQAYWEGPEKEACFALGLKELGRLYNHKNILHLTFLEEMYNSTLLDQGFRYFAGSRCLVAGRIGKLRRERVAVRKED